MTGVIVSRPFVHTLNLSTAGKHVIRQDGAYLHFWAAKEGDALALEAEINVAMSTTPDATDYIPLRYGNKVSGAVDGYTITWAAQTDVVVTLITSNSAALMQGDSKPPTQLSAGAGGGSVTAAAVSVLGSATLVAAASTTRNSVIIQNLGSADIFVGGAGVTAAAGVRVKANESLTLDNNVAAIYAIASVSGQDTRVITE